MHKVEIPDWALARSRNKVERLEPARSALLVVDMQTGFIEAGYAVANPHAAPTIPAINRLAAATRGAGGTVVWLRHTISDDPRFALPDWQKANSPRDAEGGELFREGHPAHALHAGMVPAPGDLTVLKHRFSAFLPNSSDLDALLRARGIETLIVTGTVTNVCCESTARDGFMLGYRILFVSDATSALTDAEHNATLLSMAAMFGTVATTDETLALLAAR